MRPALELPRHFWDVPYVGSNFPMVKDKLGDGTNCQGFVYAVLGHFGFSLPNHCLPVIADYTFTAWLIACECRSKEQESPKSHRLKLWS